LIVEHLHGRTAHVSPLLGTNDLVWVVFTGEGPLPDYDIHGWEEDVSLGEFLQKHTLILDANDTAEELPMTVVGVRKSKISRDYRHVADALSWRELEGCKKTVSRERGALYLLEDKATGMWSVWLETWSNFFARSHVFLSEDRQARDMQLAQARMAADHATREVERLAQQRKDLSQPSTWIVLACVAALAVWGLFRFIPAHL